MAYKIYEFLYNLEPITLFPMSSVSQLPETGFMNLLHNQFNVKCGAPLYSIIYLGLNTVLGHQPFP